MRSMVEGASVTRSARIGAPSTGFAGPPPRAGEELVITTIPSTRSTNADLLDASRTGAPEATWLRAEQQSGGKGRLGRTWVSPPGNLYASTIVRPLVGDPPTETLALVAGVALAEVAAAYCGVGRLILKWPNDLMAGPAKLAGILLERSGEAVVIGFGVNLAHHPDLIERPAASLAALGVAAPEPAAFLAELAPAFARWLARWRSEGLAPVRRQWLGQAHPIGAALQAGGKDGLFDGLEEDGALRLRLPDGRIEHIRAGDVFLL